MSLDLKRKELELIKVRAAQAELDFRIEESLDNIERLKQHIVEQENHAVNLETEINTLKSNIKQTLKPNK